MRSKANFRICILIILIFVSALLSTLQAAADDAGSFVAKGDDFLKKGEIQKAEQEYNQAWEINNGLEPILRTKLGVFLTQKRKWMEAAAQFQKASELDPNNVVTLFNLANVYASMDMLDKGILQYKKILDIQPDLYWAEFNMSNLYKEQGNLENAIVHCKNAIKINDKLAPIHFHLAILYEEITMIDKAIEEYQTASRLDPKFAKAYYNLGVVYLRQRQLDDAFELFKKTVEADPKYGQAYVNMGAVKMYQKTPDEAIPYFEKSLALKLPNRGGVLVNIAVAYRDTKKYEEALVYAKKAKDLEYKPADSLIRSIEKLQQKEKEK